MAGPSYPLTFNIHDHALAPLGSLELRRSAARSRTAADPSAGPSGRIRTGRSRAGEAGIEAAAAWGEANQPAWRTREAGHGFCLGCRFQRGYFPGGQLRPIGLALGAGPMDRVGCDRGLVCGSAISKHSSRGGCGEIASGRLDLLLATLNKPVYKARWRQANKSNPLG